MFARRSLLRLLGLGLGAWPGTALASSAYGLLDLLRPARLDHPLLQGCVSWLLVLPGRASNTALFPNLVSEAHATPSLFAAQTTATRGVSAVTTRRGGFGEIRFNNVNSNGKLTQPVDLLKLTGTMTFACWVWIRAFDASDQRLLTNGAAGPNSAYTFQFGASTTAPAFLWSNGTRLTMSTSVPTQTWSHLTATRSGTTGAWVARWYLNGRLDATSGSIGVDPLTNSGDFNTIGCAASNLVPVDGLMDDVMLWDRALSATEVWAVYKDSLEAHRGLLRWIPLPTISAGVTTGRRRRQRYLY